jgi:type IV pilus assembly protein PilA
VEKDSQVLQIQNSTLEEIFKMRKQKGFSLIELLIVVAIILIIAAIAIPNLMRSRMAANDAAAAATIRTINTTEVAYSTFYPAVGFANLTSLGPGSSTCPTAGPAGACMIDQILGCATATCTKDAFKYTITINSSGADYIAFGEPTGNGNGDKDYCAAPDAVVRYALDPTATGTVTATDVACTGSYSPL